MGHDGSGAELELAGALVVDRHPRDVTGQKIGRELNAFERAARGTGETLGQHGFADPRDVLDEHVARRRQADDGQLCFGMFADEDLLDRVDQVSESLGAAHLVRAVTRVSRSRGGLSRHAKRVILREALRAMTSLEFLARAARTRVVAAYFWRCSNSTRADRRTAVCRGSAR